MILFFDTETTNKADFRSPPEAKHQPRLVQLAAILSDDFGKEMASLNLIVKPDSYEIPEGASLIHGITTEIARNYGVGIAEVLPLFAQLSTKAQVITAHNVDFDLFIMTGEFIRAGFDSIPMDGARFFCTMKEMTDVCCLPGNYGNKWPKLQEAYRHCFGEEMADTHNALADVRACSRVYWWLKAEREKAKP